MATKARERLEFVAQLQRALPDRPAHLVVDAARLLMRHAATHGRLAVESCNGHPAQSSPTLDAKTINRLQDAWDKRIEKSEAQAEKRITAICADLGLRPDFGGDPRGYTVKVHLPNHAYNTWGGRESGWGIPQ